MQLPLLAGLCCGVTVCADTMIVMPLARYFPPGSNMLSDSDCSSRNALMLRSLCNKSKIALYQVKQSDEGKFVRRQNRRKKQNQKESNCLISARSILVSAVRSDPYQQETVLPSLDIAHCIFVSAPRESSNWDDVTLSPQIAAGTPLTCNYPKPATGSSCTCMPRTASSNSGPATYVPRTTSTWNPRAWSWHRTRNHGLG